MPGSRPLAENAAWLATRAGRVLVLLVLEAATTLRVVPTLAIVEVMVRTMPLPRSTRLLGCDVSLAPTPPGVDRLDPRQLPRAMRRRLRCAGRVADIWPFSRGPCLRRALVGGHLVRRLNPVVRLGTMHENGELVAHAWLEVDGRPLEDVGHLRPFDQPVEPGTV